MTTARTRPGHQAAEPDACHCATGRPITIATFRDQQLTRVEHRHHPIACGKSSTWTQPRDYQADTRTRRGGRR